MLQFGDPGTNIHKHENGELVDPISYIKVLAIGHKRESHAYVLEAVESYSFEVTCVNQPEEALRLLSNNTSKYDLLLVDCSKNVVDLHTFLEGIKNMDVLSIVMSEHYDDEFIINALMHGAYLVMKKPLTVEAMSLLRQDVIRERIRKHENHRHKNRNVKVESQEIRMEKIGNLGGKRKNRGESSKQATSSNYESNQLLHWSEDDSVRTVKNTVKKKACLDWTPELHAKFMKAVLQLGEGRISSPDDINSRCHPKKILDLMAVPGLTRMQVASHLQKCRGENWKNDEKWSHPSSLNHNLSSDFKSKKATVKKFGRMPPIPINQYNQEESSKPIGFNLTMNEGNQKEVNHMMNKTETGSMMLGPNQRNIEQHAGYVPFSFQRGYDSNQAEGFDHIFSETILDSIQPDVGQGVDHHTFSQDEIQASDDFLDFLRDLDGNGLNDNWIAENIGQDFSYGTPDEEMSDKHM